MVIWKYKWFYGYEDCDVFMKMVSILPDSLAISKHNFDPGTAAAPYHLLSEIPQISEVGHEWWRVQRRRAFAVTAMDGGLRWRLGGEGGLECEGNLHYITTWYAFEHGNDCVYLFIFPHHLLIWFFLLSAIWRLHFFGFWFLTFSFYIFVFCNLTFSLLAFGGFDFLLSTWWRVQRRRAFAVIATDGGIRWWLGGEGD